MPREDFLGGRAVNSSVSITTAGATYSVPASSVAYASLVLVCNDNSTADIYILFSAANTVGATKLSPGDNAAFRLAPSGVIYCYSPTATQTLNVTSKEIP
mgnify:CR=1 FL=1